MGRVSRMTRKERKRLKRLIRKLPAGSERSKLKRQLRGLRTATLDRGKLKLFGQEQRTDPQVASMLVSGEARTEKEAVKKIDEAQKSFEFKERVAARTLAKSKVQAVTIPSGTGGTITVTKGGQVTERDQRNKVVNRFEATRQDTLNIIKRGTITREQAARASRVRQQRIDLLLKTGGFVAGSRDAEDFSKLPLAERRKQVKLLRSLPGQNILEKRAKLTNIQTLAALPTLKTSIPKFVQAVRREQAARLKAINNPTLNAVEKVKVGETLEKIAREEVKKAKTKEGVKKVFAFLKVPINISGRSADFLSKTARQKLTRLQDINLQRIETAPKFEQRIIRGVGVAALLGTGRAVLGVVDTIRDPLGFFKNQAKAIRHPLITIKGIGEQFVVDPVGTMVEFAVYGKTLNLVGKGVKRSPVGQFVQKELFIRNLPKEMRTPVRKLFATRKVKKVINPKKIPTLKKADFFQVKGLTRVEANALIKALNKNDVIFGSFLRQTLPKKFRSKLKVPKDVDLATKNVADFNKRFINALPKKLRNAYKIKRESVVRLSNGEKLFDVKPLERLIPQKSLFTRTGRLPVSGFVKRLKGVETIKKLSQLAEEIISLRKKISVQQLKLPTAKTKSLLSKNLKKLTKVEKQFKSAKKGLKPSELPKIVRKASQDVLDLPTERLIKVKIGQKKIKLIGFTEQTTRKLLGTLQVLIEKNVRRAKDPQSFLTMLEVQKAILKSEKATRSVRRKIRILDDAIKVLKSKSFSKLLDQKVPGLTKEYPLINEVSKSGLKKITPTKSRNVATTVSRSLNKIKRKTFTRADAKNVVKNVPKNLASFLPGGRVRNRFNSLISISEKPSRLPIKVTRKVPSRLPTKKAPSRLPKARPSRLPISKLPLSKISKLPIKTISRLPIKTISKLPINTISKLPRRIQSKLPRAIRSRLPKPRPSRLPKKKPSKLPKIRPSKLPKLWKPSVPKVPKKKRDDRKQKKLLIKLSDEAIESGDYIYLADLYSIMFDVKAIPSERTQLLKVGRIFTGLEARAIVKK
jgi:hypothetical protein